jgi:hypothetical protein
MTAGVALVAAGAIAATPVLAPAPEIQSRIESHAVQLTAAIDNPIDVFRPVVDKVGDLVRGAIQAEFDNPFPIINGVIGRAAIDAKQLSEIGNSMGQILTTLATGFPRALGTAAYRAFRGNFTGAVQAFTPVFIGPFFQTFTQFMKLQTFVQDRFTLAGRLASGLMMSAWAIVPGQALQLFSVMNAVAGSLDELWKAVPSGDIGRIVNAIQHGIANVSVATLGLVDSVRWAFDYERTRIRDILNPPPPVPEENLTTEAVANVATLALPSVAVSLTLPAVESSTPAIEEAVAPESSTPAIEEAVAPESSTPVVEEVAAPVDVPVAEVGPATEVVVAPVDVPVSEVVVAPPGTEISTTPSEVIEEGSSTTQIRLSPIAVPGMTGTTTEASKSRDALSDSVRDSVKGVTDGIKKVAAGLGGKKAETSSASSSSSSETGAN